MVPLADLKQASNPPENNQTTGKALKECDDSSFAFLPISGRRPRRESVTHGSGKLFKVWYYVRRLHIFIINLIGLTLIARWPYFLPKELWIATALHGLSFEGEFVTAFCRKSSPEWAGTLVEPQESLAALLGSSTVGIAVCDRQLRFQGINQALATMNGVPAPAHIGKKLHQILGSVASRVAPAFEHVFETGKPFSNFKLAARLPGRTEIGYWIEDYYPIRSTPGKVVQVGVIVVEVPATQCISQALPRLTKNQLSCRERQVIRFLAEGKSNKEMAVVLGISSRTVETYRARMMLKLGLRSIAEVARYAVLNNII